MTWGAVAIAGATVIGGAMSANAAGNAADAQSASADKATQAQMMAAAQVRQDLSPWTSAGTAAQAKLNQYLGLGMSPGSVMSNGMQAGLSRDQLRQQLLSQYTKTAEGTPAAPTYRNAAEASAALGPLGAYQWALDSAKNYGKGGASNGQGFGVGEGPGYWEQVPGAQPGQQQWVAGGQQSAPATTVDEAGLNGAIDKYYADQQAENDRLASDPNYGSLLKAFHNGAEFDSGPAFSFTGENLASDPGYKFGLDQGTQGIDRGQAARGNFLSGAGMKELARFNEDYAGTKFGDAFNRSLSTYGTNLSRRQNEWNTNLGAYNDNRNRIYNYLTGTSTMGQNSAAAVGTNNQQVANSVGNNLMASGNAQAAAGIAGGNAVTSGANQLANAYNTSSTNLNSAAGWNNLLSSQGGGYSGYTGYVGGSDPIANMNTTKGWTQ